ncbi:hypothetical protein [Natrialba sp. PRR66]|uniref:hypothetical protein n=1 Tax=Natrialba sp. PRR66 TaxID=3098146 RepID=UPI002B1D15F1|nr:hypothetical protein [Natrialba sp. PRR66]
MPILSIMAIALILSPIIDYIPISDDRYSTFVQFFVISFSAAMLERGAEKLIRFIDEYLARETGYFWKIVLKGSIVLLFTYFAFINENIELVGGALLFFYGTIFVSWHALYEIDHSTKQIIIVISYTILLVLFTSPILLAVLDQLLSAFL